MSKPVISQSQDTKAKPERAEEENGASTSNDDVTFDYPDVKFEYLDNTADIQIHAWGDSIEEAFEQVSPRRRGLQRVSTLDVCRRAVRDLII
jgi:Archease protein family (MTH1598/TM1083)